MKRESLELPKIYLTATDEKKLRDLILQVPKGERRELLEEELNRAEITQDHLFPSDAVKLDSMVRFVDEDSEEKMELTLVLPGKADIQAGRISVLAPVGIALLGLAVGQSISWPMPDGRKRTLKILEVFQDTPIISPPKISIEHGDAGVGVSFAWKGA